MTLLNLRYGSKLFSPRILLLRTSAFLQKKRLIILKPNSPLCQTVLESSVRKGTFIESLVALPAWNPVLSIESSDGDQWQGLIKEFRWLFGQVNWQDRLPVICKNHVKNQVALQKKEGGNLFDGEAVSRLCAQIFFQCIFEKPLDQDSENLYYHASLEWRKEIAVKGKGDPKVKSQFMAHLLDSVKNHPLLGKRLPSKTQNPYLLSAIAQPFLISPQINFSDILATLWVHLNSNKEQKNLFVDAINSKDQQRIFPFLYESISMSHPFPVLERELTKDVFHENQKILQGTQVFILLDQLRDSHQFKSERWSSSHLQIGKNLLFGAGPRICPGRQLGLSVLSEMIRAMVEEIPWQNIRPDKGHLFSGRDNDKKENLEMVLYQWRVVSQVLWKSFLLGQKKKKNGTNND